LPVVQDPSRLNPSVPNGSPEDFPKLVVLMLWTSPVHQGVLGVPLVEHGREVKSVDRSRSFPRSVDHSIPSLKKSIATINPRKLLTFK
jgi:hypothetical protein